MPRTDCLVLLESPNASTILLDPLGPGGGIDRPGWRNISLNKRGRVAGSGVITLVANPELLNVITTPETRVVVIREPDGEDAFIEMMGPIETGTIRYVMERDGTDGIGTLDVQFADDTANLATRTVYPNPAQASTAQSVTRYTITALNAEDAARALVNSNAGPGALTARKFPELGLGTDNGVGSPVTTSFTRSTMLTDAIREVLRLGGDLGFRITAVAGLPKFEVYAPRDLTDTVWFSRDLGNIREMTFEFSAPTATVAICGNDEAGVDRKVRERVNADALAAGWRRKEIFVDARSAANLDEVDQAGDEALAEAGPKASVSVVAIETPTQRYRKTFDLLDWVSVEPFDGYVVSAQVTGVDITITAEGVETVTPLIGGAGDDDIDLKAAELAKLRKRMAQIEGAL